MTRDELFARLLIDTRFSIELRELDADKNPHGVFSRPPMQYMKCSFSRSDADFFESIVALVPFRDDTYRLSFPWERREQVKLFINNLRDVDTVSQTINALAAGKSSLDVPFLDELSPVRRHRHEY